MMQRKTDEDRRGLREVLGDGRHPFDVGCQRRTDVNYRQLIYFKSTYPNFRFFTTKEPGTYQPESKKCMQRNPIDFSSKRYIIPEPLYVVADFGDLDISSKAEYFGRSQESASLSDF